MAEVAPWEDHFSQEGASEAALTRAGFSPVGSRAVDVESSLTADQFAEDRELSSGGRLARHLLGAEGWARARATARDRFHARFGCKRAKKAAIICGGTETGYLATSVVGDGRGLRTFAKCPRSRCPSFTRDVMT